MNPGQNLPLRDIHLPDAVSWWPLAPGWWILLAIVVVTVIGLYLLIRRLTKPVIKKSARAELQQVLDDYAEHQDAEKLVQQLSILMRRIGISYLPRHQSAGVTGNSWYECLNGISRNAPLSPQSIELLSSAPYRPGLKIEQSQLDALIEDVRNWVAGLPREAAHD